jgi:hypothetical protein
MSRSSLVVGVAAVLALAADANAQVISSGTYPFTSDSGVALESMASGTTLLVTPGVDDTASIVTDIGFDFWFNGTRFTQFSANPNALVRLGPVAISGLAFDNTLFANTANAPKIAPYWEDLCTGTNGRVHSKVVGSAPSRKLVIEWLNMQVTRGAACAGAGNGTLQLWLFETTGVIRFVYGAMQAGNPVDGGHTVGIQSGAATNFASVTTLPPASVSYTTANNTQLNAIAAGTAFTFTPNILAAPTGLNFTATTQF